MDRRGWIVALVALCACTEPADRTLALTDFDGGSSDGVPPPVGERDAAHNEASPDASSSLDGASPSGAGNLETPFLDLGKHVVGSETVGQVIVLGDPAIATRARVVRIEGGIELSQLADVVTMAPGMQAAIEIAFRPVSIGQKTFIVVIDVCDAGCYAEATIVAEVLEIPLSCGGRHFGEVVVGSCSSGQLSCWNQVDDVIEIANTTVNSPFTVERISSTTLQPGEELEVDIAYCPVDPEGHGSLVVVWFMARSRFSDTPSRTEGRVLGIGLPRECTLSFEPRIDFGRRETGTRVERVTRLRNGGFETCWIEFLGTTRTSTAFQLEDPIVGTIKPLRLHEELEVKTSFSPTVAGNHADRLQMRSNDPSWPTFNIALLGFAFAEPGFLIEIETEVPLVFGGAPPLVFLPNANDGAAPIQLPFGFEYLGRPVSEIYVSTNGFIGLEPDGVARSHSEAIPSESAATEMIAWWWDDLDPSAVDANATFVWGRRALQINFVNVPLHNGPAAARVNARITIAPSNVIEVHYGEITDPSGATFQASAGWNGPGGARGADLLGCSPACQSSDWPTNTRVRYVPY
jgi:hypothetical protein